MWRTELPGLSAPVPEAGVGPGEAPTGVVDDLGEVVVVDEHDRPIGTMTKLAAHQAPGTRHRALSAFVFDPDGRVILQRRSSEKYHFAGLWSNSCCTHPAPDEPIVEAAQRRIHEELGIRCTVAEVGVFTYRAVDDASGLVEHEVDHVLIGRSADAPSPDPAEVDGIRRLDLTSLDRELRLAPDRFTPWLADALAVLASTTLPDWTSARPNEVPNP